MPRALELLDHAVRQLERGEARPLELIDTRLAEELMVRETAASSARGAIASQMAPGTCSFWRAAAGIFTKTALSGTIADSDEVARLHTTARAAYMTSPIIVRSAGSCVIPV